MSFAEDFGNRSEAISESASNPDLSDSSITSKFDTRYELLTCFSKPPQFTEASVYNRSQEMLVATPKSLWGLFDLWGKSETATFISSAARDEIQSTSAFISLLRSMKEYIVFAFKFTFSKLFVFLFSLVCFLYLDVKVNFSSLIPSAVESNRDFLVFYLCFPLKLLIISIVLYSYASYVFQDESIKKLIKLSEQNQQSRLAAQIDSTICGNSGGQGNNNYGQSHGASLPFTTTTANLLNRHHPHYRNVLTMKDVPVSLINVAVVGVKLTFTKSSSNGVDLSLVSTSNKSNSNMNANHNNNFNSNNNSSNNNKLNYHNSLTDTALHAADGMNKYNGTPIHVRPGVKNDHAILLFNFQIKFQEVCHYLYRSYEDCAVLYLHLKRTNDKKNIPKLASQRKLIKRQIVNDLRRNRHLYGTLDLIHKDKELIKSEHKGVNLEEKHLLYWQLQQCEVMSFVRQVMSKEKLSSDSKLREFLGLPAISISYNVDPNFAYRLASNNINSSNNNSSSSNNSNNNSSNAAAVLRSKFGSGSNDQSVLEVTLSRKNLEFHKEIYSTSPSEVNTSTLFTPDFGPPAPEVPINLDALSDASSAFPMTSQLRSIGGSVSNTNPNYDPNPEGVTTAHNGSREYKDIKWRGNTTETLVFEDLSRECRDMFYDPSYPKKLHQFKVRGKYYNADKKKIDADAPIGRCVLVETIEVEADHADNPTIPVPPEYQASVVPPQKKRDPKADRYDHIASKGRIARRIHVMRNFLVDKPFVHVLNLQVPGTPPVSIVCYILIPRRFIDAGVDVGTFDLHHHHHLLHSQQQQPPSPTNSNVASFSSSSSSSSSSLLDFTDEEHAAKKLLNSYLKIGNEHDRLESWGIETESDRDHTASMMNNTSDAALVASSQDHPASVEDLDNNNKNKNGYSFEVSPFIYGNSDDESEDSEESCDSESEKSTVGSISSTVKNRFFTWSNKSRGGGSNNNNNNDDDSVSSKSGKKRSGFKKSHSTSEVELDHNNNDEKRQGFFNPFKWIAKKISNKKGMPAVKSDSLIGKDIGGGGGGGDSDSDMHSEASTGHSSVGSSKSAGSRKGGVVKESQSLNVIDTKQHIMQNSSNSSLFAVDPNHNSNTNINGIDNKNGESSPKASTPSGGSSNIGLSLSPPSRFGSSSGSFEANAADQPSSPGRKTTTTPDRGVVTTATANINKNSGANATNATGAKPSKPKTINFSPTGGLVSGDVTFASPWEPGGYPPEYFTNKRFKLIPTITDGPWVVKQAVGTSSTPVLLAKRVAQRYFSGPGYMETDVDIGSSGIAAQIVGLCRGYANAFVCYMGVVMEAGEEDEELPEKLIGTIALNKINVNAQYRYKLFSDFDKEDNSNQNSNSNSNSNSNNNFHSHELGSH